MQYNRHAELLNVKPVGTYINRWALKGYNFLSTNNQTTLPPVRRILGVHSMAVNRPGQEAAQTPPPSAELKDQWSCISTDSAHRNITLKIGLPLSC